MQTACYNSPFSQRASEPLDNSPTHSTGPAGGEPSCPAIRTEAEVRVADIPSQHEHDLAPHDLRLPVPYRSVDVDRGRGAALELCDHAGRSQGADAPVLARA